MPSRRIFLSRAVTRVRKLLRKPKRKLPALSLVIALTFASLTGAAGWQVGRSGQRNSDETEISTLRTEKDLLKKQNDQLLKPSDSDQLKYEEKTARDDLLEDLRNHLPADEEIERLLKARESMQGNLLTDGLATPNGTKQPSTCCSEELERLGQEYSEYERTKTSRLYSRTRTSALWLQMRCPFAPK